MCLALLDLVGAFHKGKQLWETTSHSKMGWLEVRGAP